jgi:hypothetical protein
MEITLKRKYLKKGYTIGDIFIDGNWVCNSLEDEVRTLNSEEDKVYGKTAIPYGRYQVAMNVISPKFGIMPYYKEVCQGRLPRLTNVPFFDGILIHVADGIRGAELLQGCIGVGHNRIKGGLLHGKEVFRNLYDMLNNAYKKGEQIWISIEN